MKHYKDKNNNVYAYEDDGSQDHLIPKDFTKITEKQADAIRVIPLTYKDKRLAEYPHINDQLDEIYHKGIDAWKLKIKAVKDKYPKE